MLPLYPDLEIITRARDAILGVTRSNTEPIVGTLEAVEREVPGIVEAALLTRLRYEAWSARVSYTEQARSFRYNDTAHEIIVAPDPDIPNVLRLRVAATPQKNRPPVVRKPVRKRVEHFGRFNELRLVTSRLILPIQEALLEAAALALSVAYQQTLEWCRARFDAIRNSAASALYAQIRRLVPEHLSRELWLYAFSDTHGFYIPDAAAADVAFKSVRQRRVRTIQSPLALIADFLTHVLPYDATFSRVALTTGKAVVGEFDTAPYAGGGLATTEKAIYGADALVTQPLARTNRAALVVGYPVFLREDLE